MFCNLLKPSFFPLILKNFSKKRRSKSEKKGEEERSLALQPIYPFRKTAHRTFPSLPSSCLYGSASEAATSAT
jgi:hypothetical protein